MMELLTIEPDQYQLVFEMAPHWIAEPLEPEYSCTCNEKHMATHASVCQYCSQKLDGG